MLLFCLGYSHLRKGACSAGNMGSHTGRGRTGLFDFSSIPNSHSDPHLFHHSCFLIAEVGGSPVAALGGYDPRSLGYPTLRKAIKEVTYKMGSSGPDSEAMKRSQRVLSCIPEDIEGAWVVDSVATVPEFRRQGLPANFLRKCSNGGEAKGFAAPRSISILGTHQRRGFMKNTGFRSWMKSGIQILRKKSALRNGLSSAWSVSWWHDGQKAPSARECIYTPSLLWHRDSLML